MNTQEKTRALIEASLMTAITCIFAVIGTYIPVLTFILYFIPVPFIILGKRHGMNFVILSIIASAIIIGSLTEPIYSVFVVILPGIVAVVMGYMMKKGYSPGKVLAGGAVAALISSGLSIALASAISGINAFAQMSTMFEEGIEMYIGIMQQMDIQGENIDQIRISLENTAKMAAMVIPAAIMMSAVFLAYINYVLTVYILNRIGYKAEMLPPLRNIRLPKSILMGTFLIILLTYLTRYLNVVNYETLVVNVFVILQFIYFVQGIAVMLYFMNLYQLRKPMRVLIFVFLLFNQMGAFIIAMLGLTDALMNLRKLEHQ
ncbi:MAG: YybS family protein [Thermotaleaceae bacterium]